MIIIKYGGSIINPDGQYDDQAIRKLSSLLQANLKEQFCLVIGGGRVCRQLQDAAESILKDVLPSEQMNNARDEIGIATTKINAAYLLSRLKPLIGKELCPTLVIDPHAKPPGGYRVYLATGARPGHSTDYDTMALAKTFSADRAIKISDFETVLDVKPSAFDKERLGEYQPLPRMTWTELASLIGEEWHSGGSYPFDPAACKIGKELAFKGFSLSIGRYDQLDAMVAGKPFKGTLVQGR
ncbi:MAG: hypothetical protein JW724_06310 [Candidatus Altiarchaeota archaeon]|nr:hypothetical protein [Candidatus Altiarchaeota archaeon]